MRTALALLLLVASCAASAQVHVRHDHGSTDFFAVPRRFSSFDTVIEVRVPSVIWLWMTAHARHRGLVDAVIDYSMTGGIRGPVVNPALFPSDPFSPYPTWIPGAVSGGNILSHDHRYGQVSFAAVAVVTTPGWYRVEIWGRSGSSAAPGYHGLAELVDEVPVTNVLVVKVEAR